MTDARQAGAQFFQWGANVTAVKGKRPLHKWKQYHSERQSKDEAASLPWSSATGVGIISGLGGFRCIDIDECTEFAPVQRILDALKIPHYYAWVVKTGSGQGWHIWIRCPDELPSGLLATKSGEPGVLTGLPRSGVNFDHLEVRWERCQSLLPPSDHASGGQYQWYNSTPDAPPLEVSAERVAAAIRAVCQEPTPQTEPASRRKERVVLPTADGAGFAVAPDVLVNRAIERARTKRVRNNSGLWLACQLRDNRYDRAAALEHGRYFVDTVATDDPDDEYTLDEYEHSVEQAYARSPRDPWGVANANAEAPELRINGRVAGNLTPVQFWYAKDGAGVKIDRAALLEFLQQNGFAKAYLYGSNESQLIRQEGRVLGFTSRERIKDFVLGYVNSLPAVLGEDVNRHQVINALLKGANVYFSSALFEFLQEIDVNLQRDQKETAFFFFENGFVRVTPAGPELLPYSELDGHVWRDQIIERPITLIEDYGQEDAEHCVFGRFGSLAMREDHKRIATYMSMLGYLLHDYKSPAHAKAIILLDEVISDIASGRSGKGLSIRACGHMTPTEHIDARRIDLDSRFAFQSVDPGITRLIHFDDANEHFPFDRLFASITGNLTVEAKGKDAVSVPFEEAPKQVISTNYVVGGRGGSHNDRVFEVEFSDYFNPKHKPEDEFGHTFFYDWDASEWNRFYNYMLQCVAHYLRSGLVEYEHVNLKWKKFVSATSPEFAEFVQNFEFEANAADIDPVMRKTYEKHGVLDAFNMQFRSDVKPHSFTKWLKVYAELQGWEFENRIGTEKKQFAFHEKSVEQVDTSRN